MELKGDGFKLRRWHWQDAELLQRHANNINVSRYLKMRFPYPYSLDDANFFINLKINERPITNFVVDINNEFCGVISLDMRGDIYSKTPLLGYWLAEPYWGRGIISEAIELITAYGFEALDIICIHASVFSPNTASMRVLEKAGYIKQAILKQSIFKNGEVYDDHIYAYHQI